MGWLDSIIRRTVKDTIDRSVTSGALRDEIEKIIRREMASNPRFQFVKAMQIELLKHAPKMPKREAWDLARTTLTRFLRAEKCEFGDNRFDWSKQGAVTMIRECELQYWDA
jgi:hypothetical protein